MNENVICEKNNWQNMERWRKSGRCTEASVQMSHCTQSDWEMNLSNVNDRVNRLNEEWRSIDVRGEIEMKAPSPPPKLIEAFSRSQIHNFDILSCRTTCVFYNSMWWCLRRGRSIIPATHRKAANEMNGNWKQRRMYRMINEWRIIKQ